MIPTIGIMIAAYIITRMSELLTKSDTEILVKIFAATTILICLYGSFELIITGTNQTRY